MFCVRSSPTGFTSHESVSLGFAKDDLGTFEVLLLVAFDSLAYSPLMSPIETQHPTVGKRVKPRIDTASGTSELHGKAPLTTILHI